MRDAEGIDLGDLPAVELSAVKLERLARDERGGIERFAVPFDAQFVVGRVGGEGLKVFARACAADGDVNGSGPVAGVVDPTPLKPPSPRAQLRRAAQRSGVRSTSSSLEHVWQSAKASAGVPASHCSQSFRASTTGMRSWTSAICAQPSIITIE